ncbi:MAG: 1-deoxy-D-xylulose-5-phosphate reductoisomerase [archaeon]|nr:1-deoxy-D-xylulose-5-phosphate reductoisomerase [archaeon]
MKNICVLGSTGSIGSQTLDVARHHKKEFKITALASLNEVEQVLAQIKEFSPQIVCLFEETAAEKLREKLNNGIEVVSGIKGLEEISAHDSSDTVVTSVVGSIGLMPTISAIKKGKTIALANKETMVAGGEIVTKLAEKHSAKIIPIDSEHSAIFQCLNGSNIKQLKKVILTCSGGPFRGKKFSEFANASLEQALNHPTWKMGGKITIDSASLMNKALEVIEAKWLYDLSPEQIEVIIHPQSIVHSMVEFIDGSILAQLGTHDMRTPIQYALSYPERLETFYPTLDLTQTKTLTFEQPDLENFPCLSYGFEAVKVGGTFPLVLNAANEEVVYAFLKNQIKFGDIPTTIKKVLDSHKLIKHPTLEEVLETDKKIREITRKVLSETK